MIFACARCVMRSGVFCMAGHGDFWRRYRFHELHPLPRRLEAAGLRIAGGRMWGTVGVWALLCVFEFCCIACRGEEPAGADEDWDLRRCLYRFYRYPSNF